jgi:hypothetical protein
MIDLLSMSKKLHESAKRQMAIRVESIRAYITSYGLQQ